jgi:hypothetical protein
VIRTSNIAAAIYFVGSLIFVVPFALFFSAMPAIPVTDQFGQPIPGGGTVDPAPFAVLFLFLPILYAILGWVFTALLCLLYNLVARFMGGIEVQVEPVAPPTAAPELAGWGQPPPASPSGWGTPRP